MNISQPNREELAISQIASLALMNAFIFQDVLAASNDEVEPVLLTLQRSDFVSALTDHWAYIVDNINYYPIFHVSREILLGLPSDQDIETGLRRLAEKARKVVRLRAAFRHDLMGRVYHTLLADRKFLATYYTSVSSATILLKLALQPKYWQHIDWQDLERIANMRIADLACGTGTLLMAAAEAVVDNYTQACAQTSQTPDLARLHQVLLEEVIHGYEVLPSAAHLTASTLALRAPSVEFKKMHLFSLPHGGPGAKLGSIEFLESSQISTQDIFGAGGAIKQVGPKTSTPQQGALLPDLDICVMNPPFTRSSQASLLFGSLPTTERKAMQKRLAKLVKQYKLNASSTAGLGAIFVAVADRYIKPNGVLALVLPKTLLSGVSWQRTRELIGKNYHLDVIIVSHDPRRDPHRGTQGHWNFSDNTDLSEVLVIARKKAESEEKDSESGSVLCVNLWRNPGNSWEALGLARLLTQDSVPNIEVDQGACEIKLGDFKYGEAISVPWQMMRQSSWMLPCAFAQSELIRSAYFLSKGQICIPGKGCIGSLSLCRLEDIATLGPDPRDVYDGFDLSKEKTAFPSFWGHDSAAVTTMAQSPNTYLVPLSKAKPGRNLRKIELIWPRAGRLLIAQRPRLNTKSMAAVRLNVPVLCDVWWPVTLSNHSEEDEKILTLWLNSTFGLLLLWSNREDTQGAWVQFKKPVLGQMPILDISSLTEVQRDSLLSAYARLSEEKLLPFPSMAQDPIRGAIDSVVAETLGLPDISVLRELLGQEPAVCLRPL